MSEQIQYSPAIADLRGTEVSFAAEGPHEDAVEITAGIKTNTPQGAADLGGGNIQSITERRLELLERRLEDLAASIQYPDQFPLMVGNGSNGGFWQQLVVNGGKLINLGAAAVGTDILGCNATGSASALVTLADGQGLVFEQEDSSDMRYLWMPNPAFAAYITNNTGGGFDVYSDAGSMIKLATNQAPETSSGLFQWNGTVGRLITTGSSKASVIYVQTASELTLVPSASSSSNSWAALPTKPAKGDVYRISAGGLAIQAGLYGPVPCFTFNGSTLSYQVGTINSEYFTVGISINFLTGTGGVGEGQMLNDVGNGSSTEWTMHSVIGITDVDSSSCTWSYTTTFILGHANQGIPLPQFIGLPTSAHSGQQSAALANFTNSSFALSIKNINSTGTITLNAFTIEKITM